MYLSNSLCCQKLNINKQKQDYLQFKIIIDDKIKSFEYDAFHSTLVPRPSSTYRYLY